MRLTRVNNETISLPIVRIDAHDETYILPLREFFSVNGCQVFVNNSPSPHVSYHIVVGDLSFVKRIVEGSKISAVKSLLILWDQLEEDVVFLKDKVRRIALVDATPMTPQLVIDLLNYFFTGHTQTINLRIRKENIQKRSEEHHDLKPTADAYRIAHTIESVFSKPKKQSQKLHAPRPAPFRKILLITFTAIGCFLLPYFYFLLTIALSVFFLYRGSVCVKQDNQQCVLQATTNARDWIARSSKTFPIITAPWRIIGKEKAVHSYEPLLNFLEKLVSVERGTGGIVNSTNAFVSSFFPSLVPIENDIATVVGVEKMKSQLFSLRSDLDLSYLTFEEFFRSLPFPFSLPQVKYFMQRGQTYIMRLRENMDTLEKLLMLYPYISGYKNTMTFLVLLQNNAELRPTGGFIGSVMNVTIAEGRIANTDVKDVYEIDGQLKGHVDPPVPIRDLLAQEHWYLRDSNWNPDFRESAARASWFYEKETTTNVQGVMAVNASLVVALLKMTGPILLSDFHDSISADNFFSKSLYYTQTDFFPGSTKKKDFLGSLCTALMTKIVSENHVSGTTLFEIIRNGLAAGDIQFYFPDREPQQLVEQFQWGGRLPSVSLCTQSIPNTPCMFQYTFLNEANVGVNKANAFLRRQDRRDITIKDDGTISEVLTRTIVNSSSNEPGSGTYRTYLRIFLPRDARITSFLLGGDPVTTKGTSSRTLNELPYGELDVATVPGLTILAVAFEVPPGKEQTVRVTYDRTIPNFLTAKQLDMEYYQQKQPGIDTVPSLVRFRYPSVWRTIKTNQADIPILENEGYLEYNTSLHADEHITIRFSK